MKFREWLNEGSLDYMSNMNRTMIIDVDGIDFKIGYYGVGENASDIGTSSYNTARMSALHTSGLKFSMDVKDSDISIIKTSQSGASYIPVDTKKASKLFNAQFNGIDDITNHNTIVKKLSKLDAEKVSEKLIIKFKEYIKSNLKYISIEGSLFFDNNQQNKMNIFKEKLITLGLNIDTKTRSVLEFSGDIVFLDDIKNLIKQLNNSSYYINK